MHSSQIVIILSGPACSGKSTIAESLWKTLPINPAYIDLDTLKNMIWQAPSDDHHLDLASLNGLCLMQNYLESNHSVIIDKAFGKYKYVEPFIEEATKRGIKSYYYKLTAPLDILISRNNDRRRLSQEIIAMEARWRPYKDPDEIIRNIYDFFQSYSHSEGYEINTYKHSKEVIINKIKNDILPFG